MYHDEKLINGILHHRGTPRGAWVAYTLEELSERVITLQRVIDGKLCPSCHQPTMEEVRPGKWQCSSNCG